MEPAGVSSFDSTTWQYGPTLSASNDGKCQPIKSSIATEGSAIPNPTRSTHHCVNVSWFEFPTYRLIQVAPDHYATEWVCAHRCFLPQYLFDQPSCHSLKSFFSIYCKERSVAKWLWFATAFNQIFEISLNIICGTKPRKYTNGFNFIYFSLEKGFLFPLLFPWNSFFPF